ncbi:GNAT family N-acetyltransferase [Paenibacillus wynnii]|uniref:GCN5 family acetyltransferase n=1 Tax=Paenibacillus wynnii TaxID=268407 RepID=A0A098M8N2_9BACL|nr:GNAT family N-acetyltransferase [Paenibacillus wynnii]KGE18408.1 GCN5 family acetyltransferase [Paenibacillus wynnii]
MNHLKLVKPHLDLKNEYLSFYQEWIESGEDLVPWVIGRDPNDFEDMLKLLDDHKMGVGLTEGWVSDSTFWLVDDSDRVLGAVNIRHQLSEFLLNAGGHIGYGIRPSERGKGYATTLLKLSLGETKKLGIEEVLVVCDAWNTASEKVILKNGGRADKVYIEADGNVIKRYWIIKNV